MIPKTTSVPTKAPAPPTAAAGRSVTAGMAVGDFVTAVESALGGGPSGRRSPRPGAEPLLEEQYESELEALADAIEDRNTSQADVAKAYGFLSSNGIITSHADLREHFGGDYFRAHQAAIVVADMGDVHQCYDEDWQLWWARVDERIRKMCEERRISLHRYCAMEDDLRAFQTEVVGWFVRRNRRQKQGKQLRHVKREYVGRLQQKHFPGKPVKQHVPRVHDAPDGKVTHYREDEGGLYYEVDDPADGEWSRHIAARYLRTAQDSIIEAMDLTYD